MSRQKKWKDGDVFSVPLGDNECGFCIVLPNTFGFYDYFENSSKHHDVNKIALSRIAFKTWVSESALKKKKWSIIGNVSLSKDLLEQVYFYKQDPVTNQLWKTIDGSQEFPISKSECKFLEIAAVWDPEHIIDRLICLKAGEIDDYTKYYKQRLQEDGLPTK